MTKGQKGQKRQQMNETWNFLKQDRRANCKEVSQAPGISPTPVFRILTKNLQKRKICANWSLTAEQKQKHLENATLLNKDLKLKVNHSCFELSLLTKHGLETLNRMWNRSQTSGEVQPPRAPQNFDERNQRSSKWWFLLMITEESSWQSSMWNKC